MNELRNVFDSFKPFYPSYTSFLNKCKNEKWFYSIDRKLLERFYFSQEIVQVFQPPPKKDALKRVKGYYPKLISFFPFERFYCDTGKIVMYPYTLKEARKKEIVKPILVEEKGTDEYIKNITDNGEIRFPKDLRFTYSSGKIRKGTKPSDKMSKELQQKRDP